MHAVVTKVAIRDRQAAEQMLQDELVPRISQSPGFVAGYWMNIEETRGTSVVIYESEAAASGALERLRGNPPPSDAVSIESVELAEVVAQA